MIADKVTRQRNVRVRCMQSELVTCVRNRFTSLLSALILCLIFHSYTYECKVEAQHRPGTACTRTVEQQKGHAERPVQSRGQCSNTGVSRCICSISREQVIIYTQVYNEYAANVPVIICAPRVTIMCVHRTDRYRHSSVPYTVVLHEATSTPAEEIDVNRLELRFAVGGRGIHIVQLREVLILEL